MVPVGHMAVLLERGEHAAQHILGIPALVQILTPVIVIGLTLGDTPAGPWMAKGGGRKASTSDRSSGTALFGASPAELGRYLPPPSHIQSVC